ncbi:MAG TPA: IgGFc-binding protein [Polyangiaceae bacterium LLY-WYZ-15_(1-7)]|nr:IgGFc-binding protein [Polyangiaceae bacterium LLY-WYZ-15_(1-7)]HJL13386.1 IgGFc-binding protein [Polyangiaceae bacterium LLY-WYZ-15_(1-7)]HJL25577.1 IgGFc-binding protein [Polyangiaceae bacterium LLY-WYZ-15_(1-7)]HJL28682.1 IgGFc-binding protein [Polyangiaceae bacterium LLY-WYZ-15_(1-7)]HJL35939.1 IgGFc-binding protein [Polyangiaceae bacterium LLY-WYZ-15_(1-7)]
MTSKWWMPVVLLVAVGCGDDDRRPARDGGAVDAGGSDGSTPGVDSGPMGCTPGEFACAGNIYYQCGPDGMSRTNEMVCEGACDPAAGCVACMPGTRRCEGTVSMVCAPDGSGFVTARDCAENGSTCGSSGFCNDACGAAESSRSNIGCEYWPVPLANVPGFEDRYDFRVVVANPDDAASANVRVFRGSTMVSSVSVPPNGLQDIVLPWIAGMSDGIEPPDWTSLTTPNGAYRLISDLPVTVAQFNPFEYDNGMTRPNPDPLGPPLPDYSFTNDASLLLPAHSFTGNYIASSFVPLSTTQDQPGLFFGRMRQSSAWPGYVTIVGITPEPTTVQMSLSAPIAADASGRFPAASRGGSISFTIQRGEVVHVVAAAPPSCASGRPGFDRASICPDTDPGCDAWLETCNETEYDLTGSRVIADHPIAVFGGHACAYVPYNAEACDHLENQMPPLETWGQNYVSGPLGDPGSTLENVVRITAAFDGTNVTIDPPQGGTSSLTLNAGQWQEFTASSPFSVNADRGVMVTQYLIGQFANDPPADRGDPAMMVLPPREQFRSDYTFVTPSSYNASTEGQSYLLIVRPVGLDVSLDGSNVSATWTTVGDREVGIVPVGGGTHTMEAADTFGVFVYGMGQFTSYAYPAGLNLEEILLI